MVVVRRCHIWINTVASFACIALLMCCSESHSSDSLESTADNDGQSLPDRAVPVAEGEAFHNPVDNKTYVAPGGWVKHEPKSPRDPSAIGRIYYKDIRLLTSEQEIETATTVDELADLIRRVEQSAQHQLQAVESGAVLVQFACSPNSHTVQLAHQGNISQEQMQSFYDELVGLEPIRIATSKVTFQVNIQIDPE